MFANKLSAVLVLTVSLGAGAGILLSQQGNAVPLPAKALAAEPAPKLDPSVPRSRKVHKALAHVFTQEEVPANTPLQDVLKDLSDKHKVEIIIDKKAFDAIGVQKAGEQPVELPKMTDVRLSTVLKKLLRQVVGDVYRGTYQVRPGHIEITTEYHQMAECPAESPDHPAIRQNYDGIVPSELSGDPSRKITPVVHVDADNRSLAEVLRDLSEDAELEIIIDRRAMDKAKTPVNLTLNNSLFDSAVSLLVEQADLDWMWIDNMVYVATKDDLKVRKDRKRAAEQEKVKLIREAKDIQNPPAQPIGLGVPGVGVIPGALGLPGLAPNGAAGNGIGIPAPPPARQLGPRPGGPPAAQ
jgi:hypothetical protein